ncbi:MAG: hypothetical protein DHS20C08_20620 [Rhodomicrobium sp.]|nr:MAG: hypothetical protein DHS20C08_20620 [Rhodomicrobium sp.]
MIGSGLSVVIELIVSLLLVVTIGYCYVVNRKLTALRTDQSGLRQVIVELNRSSERAEQAIGQMRRTAQAVDGDIASQCEAARQSRDELVDAMERSRNARAVLEKFGDVDLSSLKGLQMPAQGNTISNKQMAVAKELKRQRLGFGREQMKPQNIKEPQHRPDAVNGQNPHHSAEQRQAFDQAGYHEQPPVEKRQASFSQHDLAKAMQRLQTERSSAGLNRRGDEQSQAVADSRRQTPRGEDSWAVEPGALMRAPKTMAQQAMPQYRESA